jgi:hypothetical protein
VAGSPAVTTPDTLTTRNNVAYLTGAAGDAAGALRLYREVRRASERVLGPDHRTTRITRDDVQHWEQVAEGRQKLLLAQLNRSRGQHQLWRPMLMGRSWRLARGAAHLTWQPTVVGEL